MLKIENTYIFSSNPNSGARNVSPQGNRFSVQLDDPIAIPALAKNCSVDVIQANIWNNSFNISGEIGNNNLKILTEDSDFLPFTLNIVIPDGLYGLNELNELIQLELVNNNLEKDVVILEGEESTSKVVLSLGKNTQLDFTISNSCRDVLGFDSRLAPLVAKPTPFNERADNVAAFNRVNSFIIKSDIISQGIPLNNQAAGILSSVSISSVPGSLIIYQPYIPAKSNANELIGKSKNYFTFELLDQELRTVDTNSEFYDFTLRITYDIPY